MIVKKTITKHIEHTNSNRLSIQFSLDGFSFCIENKFGQTHTFSEYIFDVKINTPAKVLEKITSIFKSEALLQQDFNSITVIHENNLATLVPETHFDVTQLNAYLKFTVKTFETDLISFDTLDKYGIKNVYVPYVNINNFIFQHFGEFVYKHHTTVLIDKLMASSLAHKNTTMFVNVSKSSFDIIVLNEKKLLLCNTFSLETNEDFIYHILFIAEQLQLDPENFPLLLSGAIDKENTLYQWAFNYIRNVDFIKNNASFFSEPTNLKNHQHYILIN